MRVRDTNLDLLRAVAIVLVLVLHVSERWPGPQPAFIRGAAAYGTYGVDLFFILSGWLIGGLFWREQGQFGNVQLGRFVCRRALRTVPPYLGALVLTGAGISLARHEPFDPGYLVFIQNYYRDIPFFHISWSLCVEEHFYLAMPLLALLLLRVSRRPEAWLLVLTVLPMGFRALVWDPERIHMFGFQQTATHLRYEGLLLGVWAAFLSRNRPAQWDTLRRVAPGGCLAALTGLVAVAWAGGETEYVFSYFAVALVGLFSLVWVVGRGPVLWSDRRVVFWVATTSYSVYLTHWVTLSTTVHFWDRMPSPLVVRFALIVGAFAVAGAAFYWLVEIPSLAVRHRLMPGRTHERSPLRDVVAQG